MTLIDDLLGEPEKTTVENGEDGTFEVTVRPRRTGPKFMRTSMVSFARPGTRGRGFGVQLQVLRLIAKSRQERDPIAESSFQLGAKTAQSVLDWIDTLEGVK